MPWHVMQVMHHVSHDTATPLAQPHAVCVCAIEAEASLMVRARDRSQRGDGKPMGPAIALSSQPNAGAASLQHTLDSLQQVRVRAATNLGNQCLQLRFLAKIADTLGGAVSRCPAITFTFETTKGLSYFRRIYLGSVGAAA